MTYFRSISTAGFAATAVSYGPARMGFGLFVPEFRSTFEMSSSTVGFVSGFGFFGLFVSLLIGQVLLERWGPEVPVVSGLCAATAGLVTVALAPNLTVLAIGVFLAASSAGFTWTPFNDAVRRKIPDVYRAAALSEISTGTSIGIAAAGLAALATVVAGVSWRVCWTFFALAGAVAVIINWAALRDVERSPYESPEKDAHDLLQVSTLPLFVIAFVFGMTSSIFISFAADHMLDSGGVPGLPTAATPGLVFVLFGLFGLAGLMTDRAREAIGLLWLLRLLMLAGAISMTLPAIWPASWIGLIPSSALQGINVMMTSAVLAFWSVRLFPSLPSFGFTAALLAMAVGSIVGPVIAGVASDSFGPHEMFLGAAALPATAALLLRKSHVRERPVLGQSANQSDP